LGKDDPDALWMAAHTLSFFTGELATAANVIDRALTLNPNSAHAWMVRGLVSLLQNQPDLAIDAFKHAMRLSPVDPLGARAFTFGLAAAHLEAGRYASNGQTGVWQRSRITAPRCARRLCPVSISAATTRRASG